MGVIGRVKTQAKEAEWNRSQYLGLGNNNVPISTYTDIISTAFEDVTKTINHARHCSYDEMYRPHLGDFRRCRSYSSLAPSLCIARPDRLWRTDGQDLKSHKAYQPKRGEWLVLSSKNNHKTPPRMALSPSPPSEILPPAGPSRYYHVPTSNTRYQNHFLYWKGRVHGTEYVAPFLQYEDTTPAQDRRYHRIFWSPDFINITPSCRHATHLMLSAY